MDLGIRGRVALVGASGRGLGLATAHRLGMEGCHVAICDKDESVLEPARAQVQGADKDIKVVAFPVDLTQAASIDELVGKVKGALGPIDILVTNSGGPPPGGFDDADDAKWDLGYKLTFLSAVRLIRAVLPGMKARKWGRIINFTSRALKEPIPNLMISNAIRLAVGGMAKTLASEVAHLGITVNNLLPGPTTTDRQLELIGARAKRQGVSQDDALKAITGEIPLGRLARPEEQAAAAAFLASEWAGYITGINFLVDGGAVKAF
jgi:3-oxoacyl-[acyl-carrier protein] reductase